MARSGQVSFSTESTTPVSAPRQSLVAAITVWNRTLAYRSQRFSSFEFNLLWHLLLTQPFMLFSTFSEGLRQRWKSEISPHCVTNDRVASEGVARKQDFILCLSVWFRPKTMRFTSNDSHTHRRWIRCDTIYFNNPCVKARFSLATGIVKRETITLSLCDWNP